ncbi:hypothetical protein [Mesoplasma corruscae]|uniref:Uncharacterized protein n=1 Tax=Mesoplasma corruscae TaxID=216874 RepID=A0A2S5RG97_9MOLU|nr:hypothetical protein [Mesoplasma corruscae]PPE06330.1 hypothetical protein MCORR_v1c06350 [Mesoplasma corruscae]
MMTWDVYIYLIYALVSLLFGSVFVADFTYISAWKNKYFYIKMNFGQKINIKEFPVLLKAEVLRLFIFYIIAFIVINLSFFYLCFLIPSDLWIKKSHYNISIIVITLIYLLTLIVMFILVYRNIKKMKKFKIFSKAEAEACYIEYFKKNNDVLEYQKIFLYNVILEEVSWLNKSFQNHQIKIKRKVQKVVLKNDPYKELKLFLRYLRAYAFLIKRIRKNCVFKTTIDQKEIDFNDLQFIFINNFQSMFKS